MRWNRDVSATFADWAGHRTVASVGTNAGSTGALAYQDWRHFKEAFTPELVAQAVRESTVPVSRCLDPFGGSGTTALACQFLGVRPATIEVNPYLADLIKAKLARYDSDALIGSLGKVLQVAASRCGEAELDLPAGSPPTLIEPGVKDRWVYDAAAAHRLAALLEGIDSLSDPSHRRLFRVLLGGILVEVSNVVVNGKGRRYRRNWKSRPRDASLVFGLFSRAVRCAITDIHRFGVRACQDYSVIVGDSRRASFPEADLAVFSPPYPNSFDYTDVYNLELWVLGYLSGRDDNWDLRKATVCSHVQIDRSYPSPPSGSPTLHKPLDLLRAKRAKLWNKNLVDMGGAYFADMRGVLQKLRAAIVAGGQVWMVVGDSRYAGVGVPTAEIVLELCGELGWRSVRTESCRSMRISAQQGGNRELQESLLVLE